ncbi:hypothetical protein CCAN2_1760033 [Capnocytophaga canimorsus]|nr:hypothetical protein CCAN2_1760033 [Capnocytophaga canimorsus]
MGAYPLPTTITKKSQTLYKKLLKVCTSASKKSQSAITEGQFAVWYNEDELIGSGVIS